MNAVRNRSSNSVSCAWFSIYLFYNSIIAFYICLREQESLLDRMSSSRFAKRRVTPHSQSANAHWLATLPPSPCLISTVGRLALLQSRVVGFTRRRIIGVLLQALDQGSLIDDARPQRLRGTKGRRCRGGRGLV
jgi:hypothetical protein